MIRRYFFTGLTILLPVFITLFVFNLLITLMTKPFQGLVEDLLGNFGLYGKPFLFLSAAQMLRLTSKILIIATLIVGTFLVGFLARMVLTHYLFRMGDYLIHRIPIVNKIYKAGQDVMKTLFLSENNTFSQVVLVRFPHKNAYSIGMITNESSQETSDIEHGGLISVFIPATPNPTMGFMLMFKRDQLIFLDMKINDALKAVISSGVLFSNLLPKDNHEKLPPTEAHISPSH